MRAVVAGGGITGLTAAHDLVRAGVDVTLLESGSVLGGKVSTDRRDGFVFERGPDSFLTLRPAALDLCRELGLADDVTPPLEPHDVFLWHDGRLVPVPEGTGMGIPTRFVPFLLSGLLSPREKARAAVEIFIREGTSRGDVSIGAFLRRRFGDAVVDRLAGPLISAIYGAPVDELSLDALLPRLREAVQRYGSLVRAGLAARGRGSGGGVPVVTLRGGMGSLVDALAARLAGCDLRVGVGLRSVEASGPGYVARLSDGSSVRADAVVIAVPAAAAARALENVAPAASSALVTIPYRGTVAVSLAYDLRRIRRPLRGHGFLVADRSMPISACTWSSSKWPARTPAGTALVRATLGSADLQARDPSDLVEIAHRAVAQTVGIEGYPVVADVAVWDGAMPRYTVGHLDRLARIGAALLPFPGIALAGAAYRGTGVPDCIAQGRAAAERVLAIEPGSVPVV